jgi:predicted nucleic acid-binding protein
VRFSIDTNVLVAVKERRPKYRTAVDVMRRASSLDCVVTLQALGETFRILVAKYCVLL